MSKTEWQIIAVLIFFWILIFLLSGFIIKGIRQDLDSSGGVAKTIGTFIKDVREASE